MTKKYPVYQVIDHPTLTKKLIEVCMLELNDSEVESVSRLSDLGDRLYLLTEDAVKGLSDCNSALAILLAADSRVPHVIDLREAFTQQGKQ